MRILLVILDICLLLFLLAFFIYFNNTSNIDARTISFYKELKNELRSQGYSPKLVVISGKRAKFHNSIQVKFSGAASKSKHLTGDAIDFLVFDINGDGNSNEQDVKIVYHILDQKIIKDKGGIGTYLKEHSFFNKQMVHVDCRGYKARWD